MDMEHLHLYMMSLSLIMVYNVLRVPVSGVGVMSDGDPVVVDIISVWGWGKAGINMRL